MGENIAIILTGIEKLTEVVMSLKDDVASLDKRLTAVELDVKNNHKQVMNKINGLGDGIKVVRSELGNEIKVVRSELGNEIKVVRSELGSEIRVVRSELGNEIKVVRSELGNEIKVVRSELGNEINGLGHEIKGLREEITVVRNDLRIVKDQTATNTELQQVMATSINEKVIELQSDVKLLKRVIAN